MMLAIYGPTATGKTALAIRLARKFNGELISADSRQVYKNLDIGTGKVDFSSQVEKHKGYWVVDGVKIHGFDLVEPPGYEPGLRKVASGYEPGLRSETFTAADFVKFANAALIRIRTAEKLPIFVGGTGFYIKALINGIDTIGIKPNSNLREKLQYLSTKSLFQKLAKINPSRAKSMNESDRANPRRLIRAIEIAMSDQKTNTINQPSNHLLIGLNATNNYLYDRADDWLKTRLEKGMIEEVKKLIDNNVKTYWLDNLGLEYRWITRHLKGEVSKVTAIERLKGDIHNFIRRQKTYFKQLEKNNLKIFDILQKDYEIELEKTVYEWFLKH